MRAAWVTLFCVLIMLSLLVLTGVDAKKSKKNKKPPKDELSKGKLSNGASSADTPKEVNPKMKPLQTKQPKQKADKKLRDDAQIVPIITEDIPDIQVQQEKLDPPSAQDKILTTRVQDSQTSNCSTDSVKTDSITDIEKNVTALWAQVDAISNPVHIHVHGGRVSSPSHHKHHEHTIPGSHSSKDKFKSCDRRKDQCHSQCQKCHHSPSKQTSVKDEDHSVKSHSHHNKSSSHGGHGHHHRGHEHTVHHHSHGHSPKSHNESHEGHNESHAGHDHRRGDHSYKSHHHGHSHRFGHSPSKFHDDRRGHHFGEGRGHSTHVHIHVTVDEKPGPSSEVPSRHCHPDITTAAPASEEAVYARCEIRNYDPDHILYGYVLLRQKLGTLEVKINISGFYTPPPGVPSPPTDNNAGQEVPGRNLRGFHVHEFGDFSQGCASFGGHYNPEGAHHGGLEHNVRHVGDWGNIQVNDQGDAISYFSVTDSTLRGPHSILGRGIVVHGQADDLGEGDTPASHSSGNAGARLACCIIGQTKPIPDEIWQEGLPQQTTGPPDTTSQPAVTTP